MISAVILTHNEEKNISKCVLALKWCDEVLVIDDQSTDNTVAIAKKSGAKIYVRALSNNFSAQRNFGLQKAKGDWVLFVDADELVTSALWFEIMQHTNNPSENYKGFLLKRQDIIWNSLLKHGETGNIKFLRLAKKNAGEWVGAVHETWDVKGDTLVLNNPLMHRPHITIKKFIREINFYTNIRAKELFDKRTKTYWPFIVLYPIGKFIQNYIVKQGFRDGTAGLVLAMMMSFHSFLVRSKLWLLWQGRKMK